MTEEKKCKDLVNKELKKRLAHIRCLWDIYKNQGADASDEDGCRLDEFGLCFNYEVKDNEEGYFLWQLSTGGPGDEFRFFVNSRLQVYRIEYWYLDWFDGAHVKLSGKDALLMQSLWTSYFAVYAESDPEWVRR